MGNVCFGNGSELPIPTPKNTWHDFDDYKTQLKQKGPKCHIDDHCVKGMPLGKERDAIGLLCDVFCTETKEMIPEASLNALRTDDWSCQAKSEMKFDSAQRKVIKTILCRIGRFANRCFDVRSANNVIDLLLYLNWDFRGVKDMAFYPLDNLDTLYLLLSWSTPSLRSNDFTHLERQVISRREELGITLRHHHLHAILSQPLNCEKEGRFVFNLPLQTSVDPMLYELLPLIPPSAVSQTYKLYGLYTVQESPILFVWNAVFLELIRVQRIIRHTMEAKIRDFEMKPCAALFACYPVHSDEPLLFGRPETERLLDSFPNSEPRVLKYKSLLISQIKKYRVDRAIYERGRRACLNTILNLFELESIVINYLPPYNEPKKIERFRTISVEFGPYNSVMLMRAY